MTLHLIRLPLRLSHLARWAATRGWVQRHGFDEGRALHHLLAETFGIAALQPFRLLVPPRSDTGNLYAYTSGPADSLRDMARAIALPEHLSVLDLSQLEEKPMPVGWVSGQQLGFDLITRPIRRLKAPLGAFAEGAEIDAFLAHVLHNHPDSPPATQETRREAVYVDWLSERLDGAARLEPDRTRLAQFCRRRVARGSVASEGPEATFHGTLEISDPLRFADLLARGVGRHRAYGYGMLMLRAPNRPPPER
jgi:CRISPR system Cascade subunit CasE